MAFFDLIVLAIVGLSLLIGLLRGFFHELLSLLSWGGALLIAWFGYPTISDILAEWIPNALLRDIAGGVIAFIAAMIILGLLSNALNRTISELKIRSTDRALGGLFGVARGYIVACLLFAFAHWFWEESTPPELLQTGKTRPIIAIGAREVIHLLVSYEETPLVQRLRQITDAGSSAYELHQKMISPETEDSTAATPEKGYDDSERETLNDLFPE